VYLQHKVLELEDELERAARDDLSVSKEKGVVTLDPSAAAVGKSLVATIARPATNHEPTLKTCVVCRRSVAHSNKSELRYVSHDLSGVKMLNCIRHHYLEDLKPYICLYDGCSLHDVRYSTIRDWTAHIRASHGQVWRCLFGCNDLFSARVTFEEHMVDEHHTQFTFQELPTLTELCMKHTLATDATQCPCCGETTESSDQFYRHLAKHLEDIATLSLMPNLPCEFSASIDDDPQLADTIPSYPDQEGSVQSTGPLQQHVSERTDDHDTQKTLRRAHSAPSWERGLGMGSHDVTP